MIEQSSTIIDLEPEPVTALARPAHQALVTVERPARRRRGLRLASWSLAAVAAALLALATFGITAESVVHYGSPIRAEASGVPVQPREVTARAYPAPPPIPRATGSRQRARPASARRRRPASQNRSFFGRELFRIVIR